MLTHEALLPDFILLAQLTFPVAHPGILSSVVYIGGENSDVHCVILGASTMCMLCVSCSCRIGRSLCASFCVSLRLSACLCICLALCLSFVSLRLYVALTHTPFAITHTPFAILSDSRRHSRVLGLRHLRARAAADRGSVPKLCESRDKQIRDHRSRR